VNTPDFDQTQFTPPAGVYSYAFSMVNGSTSSDTLIEIFGVEYYDVTTSTYARSGNLTADGVSSYSIVFDNSFVQPTTVSLTLTLLISDSAVSYTLNEKYITCDLAGASDSEMFS
jgi:hypothetical protein